MIESCPKKRMIFIVSLLGLLTILILIIESHWTEKSNISSNKRIFPVEQNSTCGEKEKFEVIQDCQPCSAFEIASASQSIGVCIHTHYKEVLKCSGGETVTRSCDRAAYYDERAFWRFEAFMFVAAVLSTVCMRARKHVLNKRFIQRVQRQLANSV